MPSISNNSPDFGGAQEILPAYWSKLRPGDFTPYSGEHRKDDNPQIVELVEALKSYYSSLPESVPHEETVRHRNNVFEKLAAYGIPSNLDILGIILEYLIEHDWLHGYSDDLLESLFPVVKSMSRETVFLTKLRGLSGYWCIDPLLRSTRTRELLTRDFFEEVCREKSYAKEMGYDCFIRGSISIWSCPILIEEGLNSGLIEPMCIDSLSDLYSCICKSIDVLTSGNYRLNLPDPLPFLDPSWTILRTGAELLDFVENDLARFTRCLSVVSGPTLFLYSKSGQKWIMGVRQPSHDYFY